MAGKHSAAALTGLVLFALARSTTAAEPPALKVSNVNIKTPAREARPDDTVGITLRATHPQGVRALYVSAQKEGWQPIVTSAKLSPTGEAGQFRGTFIVPSTNPVHPPGQLQLGRYSVQVTKFVDGQGRQQGVSPCLVIGHLDFNPVVTVQIEAAVPSRPQAAGQATLVIVNSTDHEQEITLGTRVYDHF